MENNPDNINRVNFNINDGDNINERDNINDGDNINERDNIRINPQNNRVNNIIFSINDFIRIRDNIQENLIEDLNNLFNIDTHRYVHLLGLLFLLINRNISINFIEEHFESIIDLFYMYYNDIQQLRTIIIDFIVLYRMRVVSPIMFHYLRNYRFE